MVSRSRALITVKPLVNPLGGSRRTGGRATAYAAIHHKLSIGNHRAGQARTGDPHWMFTVQEKARNDFNTTIQGHIQDFTGNKRSSRLENYSRELQRDVDKLVIRTNETPLMVAKRGALLGKKLAPKKTRTLMRAISYGTT